MEIGPRRRFKANLPVIGKGARLEIRYPWPPTGKPLGREIQDDPTYQPDRLEKAGPPWNGLVLPSVLRFVSGFLFDSAEATDGPALLLMLCYSQQASLVTSDSFTSMFSSVARRSNCPRRTGNTLVIRQPRIASLASRKIWSMSQRNSIEFVENHHDGRRDGRACHRI